MIGGLVAGNVAVGQFQDAARFVALGHAVGNGVQAAGTAEVAVVLRVTRFRWDFMAEFGRSGNV